MTIDAEETARLRQLLADTQRQLREQDWHKEADAIDRIAHEAMTDALTIARLWPRYNSAHEAMAVLLEEVDELKEHVWMNQRKRDLAAMRKEAMDVLVVGLRIVAALDDEAWVRK